MLGLPRLLSLTVRALAIGAAVVLSCAVSTAQAAPCNGSAMYIAAHADDTLLFQSPTLLQDIQSGRCVRTVFLTAGDAGRAQSYWATREDGAEAGYAQMAGVTNQWTGSQISVEGHSIHLETLNAHPGITIAYLRLPDGGTNGTGFPLYSNQSLMKLWNNGNGGSPSIASIKAVDNSATYSYSGLIDTLTSLMDDFEPQQVDTQNYKVAILGPDHADHAVAARLAQKASGDYDEPHRLVGFLDYETSSKAQNVFGTLLGAKSLAFYKYGAHDSDACGDEAHCAETSYASWLKREYTVGTETTGVVANAGFMQESTPSTGVTLDGSQSSGQSTPLSYAWTQTGGPTVALSGANTAAPSFTTPSHPTVLTFSLTVGDKDGLSAPDFVKVRVPASDPTPVAVVGPKQNVSSGSKVTLDGSGSWDPNSLDLQYGWLQTSGPTVTLTGSATATPSFTAPTGPTTLTFSLAVSNGTQTSALATATVEIKGIAPTITSGDSATFTTGVAGSFKVTTTGSPKATLSKLSGSLPEGVSLTDNGDGTATIAGTPAASTAPPAGSSAYPITIKALNSVGNVTQAFTLTVQNPGTPPAFTSANATTFTTGVNKSFTITTTGAPTAALSRTGTLPTGLSFKDNGDGTATISGTAAGSAAPPAGSTPYPLTLEASSGAGSKTQAFTLTVQNPGTPPTFTSAASTTFTTGVNKSFTISTAGAPVAALSKTGTLPSGLTFVDNGDGTATISGTAAAGAAPPAGSTPYPLTLEATSGAGSKTQSFTLTVSNPGTAPAFTSANATTFTTGVNKSFTITTTGAPTAALSRTGTLPTGLSFKDNGDGTGTISGTAAGSAAPPAGSTPYPLTLEATSGAGSKTQSFTLTVQNPGTAPNFTSANATTFTTGVNKSFTIATTGAPVAALTRTGALPEGLTFNDNGDGTGTISGTASGSTAPPAGSTLYPLTLEATSGAGSKTQSFTLTVANPGVAPAFTSANATTFTTGVDGSFTVATTGAPTAVLSRTGTLPTGLTFKDNGDGTATISGTAAAAAAPPAGSTPYPLTLEASSGAGSKSQSFTLTVANPGTAPVFTSAASTTFTTGVNKSFTISTTGAPTAALSRTGALPTGLSFKDNNDGTGTISGTAAAAAAPPAGSTPYPLTLEATSGAGSKTQAFTLTVQNPGTPPTFNSAASTTFITGVNKSFTITTTGAPAAALSKTGALPEGLVFKDNGDGTGTISGTAAAAAAPPAGSTPYPLTLEASSGAGDKTQAFTLTVANPGTAPAFTSAASTTFTTGAEKSFTVSTTGAPTAALSRTGTLPSGLAFKDNGDGTGTISGTAAAAAAPPAGSTPYPLTLEATSGAGSKTQAFTLTVANPGTAPNFTSADATTFTTGVNKSFTVTATGAPTAALSRTGTLPSGVAFKDNGDGTATISGTAAAAAAPPAGSTPYPLTLEASSGAGEKAQSFTLTVQNPGTAPNFTSASSTTFTTGVEKSFTVSTTGAPAAALSKSGALPEGLSFNENGDGTATISGTAAGSAAPPAGSTPYPLTLEATSGAGNKTQSFTLTVANPGTPPSFTSAASTTFITGVDRAFTVSTVGAPTAALGRSGSLPTGLSFKDNNDGTATISGTAAKSAAPPAGSTPYPLTLEASSGAGSKAQAFTLTVQNPGDAPFFTSEDSATFTTGVAGSFEVSSIGSPSPTLAVLGTLPDGLVFSDDGGGTGSITGTPSAAAAPPGESQAYTLILKGSSTAGSASQPFTLTVHNPGVAPVFTSAGSAAFTVGASGSFTVATTGAPAAVLSSSGALPAGVSFNANGDGTATISGTPAASAAPAGGSKAYSLTLGAASKVGAASQALTLVVSNGATPPPTLSLSHGRVQLRLGSRSRRVVKVDAPPLASLRCSGALPRGARCRTTPQHTVIVEGSRAVSRPGTYRLTVEVVDAGGSARQPLIVQVRRPTVSPRPVR